MEHSNEATISLDLGFFVVIQALQYQAAPSYIYELIHHVYTALGEKLDIFFFTSASND
jgi:hypothetical protein